jgi:predicted DNA-binding protein YlxM (UPF0122 family)
MRNLPTRAHMSLSEIAEEEGISKAAVNMCLRRALRKLRSQGLVLKMQELADGLDKGRKECQH